MDLKKGLIVLSSLLSLNAISANESNKNLENISYNEIFVNNEQEIVNLKEIIHKKLMLMKNVSEKGLLKALKITGKSEDYNYLVKEYVETGKIYDFILELSNRLLMNPYQVVNILRKYSFTESEFKKILARLNPKEIHNFKLLYDISKLIKSLPRETMKKIYRYAQEKSYDKKYPSLKEKRKELLKKFFKKSTLIRSFYKKHNLSLNNKNLRRGFVYHRK